MLAVVCIKGPPLRPAPLFASSSPRSSVCLLFAPLLCLPPLRPASLFAHPKPLCRRRVFVLAGPDSPFPNLCGNVRAFVCWQDLSIRSLFRIFHHAHWQDLFSMEAGKGLGQDELAFNTEVTPRSHRFRITHMGHHAHGPGRARLQHRGNRVMRQARLREAID